MIADDLGDSGRAPICSVLLTLSLFARWWLGLRGETGTWSSRWAWWCRGRGGRREAASAREKATNPEGEESQPSDGVVLRGGWCLENLLLLLVSLSPAGHATYCTIHTYIPQAATPPPAGRGRAGGLTNWICGASDITFFFSSSTAAAV